MYIKVKVIAKAKKEMLEKENETTLVIRVKEEAKGAGGRVLRGIDRAGENN